MEAYLKYPDKVQVFDRGGCPNRNVDIQGCAGSGASVRQGPVIDGNKNEHNGMVSSEAKRVKDLFENEKRRGTFQGYLRKEYLETRRQVRKGNKNSYNKDTGGGGIRPSH